MSTTTSTRSIAKRSGVSLGLVLAAVLLGGLGAVSFVEGAVGDPEGLGEGWLLVIQVAASQIGFALAAAAFLWFGPGWPFVAIDRPSTRGLRVGAVALGLAVAIEGLRQLTVLLTDLGAGGTVPVAENPEPLAAAVLVAFMIFGAPVAEELLFRATIQQYVTNVSSPAIGITVATLLFVPVHAIGILIASPTTVGAAAVVVALAGVSVAFGLAYEKTGNLAVPIGVHASYNAIVLFGAALLVG